MADNLPYFLKRDKDSIIFSSTGELVFYIPESYFERGIAITNGEYISIIGIFNYAIFENGNVKGGLKRFNFPSRFVTKPSIIEKVKGIKLTKNSKTEDYRLLKYVKDDVIIVSTKVPMIVDNIEDFFKMFNSGMIPNTIPYNELQNYFLNNIQLNGASYNVAIALIGVVISEVARAANNPAKPFRLSGSSDLNAYNMINIKEIPKLISPFTSMTSENWDESLANAITNKSHTDSPLEQLFVK